MTDVAQYIVYDRWLAQIFQRDVYRLDFDEMWLKDGVRAEQMVRLIEALRAKPIFIHAKVSTASLLACRFLENMGFKLVDTNVVFDKTTGLTSNLRGNCTLRVAVPGDREQVTELARRNFGFSRFHFDDVIPKKIADKVMAEWAGNFFSGERGDEMIVATTGDKIVGFTQFLRRNEETIVIDLVSVDGDHRQKGIASDMITFAESQFPECNRILVGTQVANIPSVRLYEKMGFRIFASRYVLHFHSFPDQYSE